MDPKYQLDIGVHCTSRISRIYAQNAQEHRSNPMQYKVLSLKIWTGQSIRMLHMFERCHVKMLTCPFYVDVLV